MDSRNIEEFAEFGEGYTDNNAALSKRMTNTLRFAGEHLAKDTNVLDLGVPSLLSAKMIAQGLRVTNTDTDVDLDLDYSVVENDAFEAVTAFEILEHLVSPFPLLKNIKAPKLLASIPLKLWFVSAYWNDDNPYDCHYHEFESRQFDMLLNKAGWKILKSEKWTSAPTSLGIRPLLRRITPRYYIVYCERS